MTSHKSATQDRRVATRDNIILSCKLIFKGREHSALITDISPGGAFLRSEFLPPVGAAISIQTEASLVGVLLVLEAKVLRYDLRKTKHHKTEGFAIQFSDTSAELVDFINKYAKPQIEESPE
jgi:hypothetical protein